MSDSLFIGSNGYVAALEAASGREIWRTTLGGFLSATSGQDVTVLDHEDRVYVGCNGHVFCLDAATGSVVWKNDLSWMGHNDVTLSIGSKSIQVIAKRPQSPS